MIKVRPSGVGVRSDRSDHIEAVGNPHGNRQLLFDQQDPRAFVTRMLPVPMRLRIRSPESGMDWRSKNRTQGEAERPQHGICQPRSLADRTPISGLWVDAGKVQVGDDPVRIIIGVNIVHGHFDTRSLPAAGGLLRQIALVNNL